MQNGRIVYCDWNKAQLLEQCHGRILKAAALEKPDRTPVVLKYAGFSARVTHTPLPEFLSSRTRSIGVMIEAFHFVGDADGIDYGSYSAYGPVYL